MEKLRGEKNISKEKGDGLVCERELCSRCEERPQRGLGTRREGRDQDKAGGDEQPKVCKIGIKDAAKEIQEGAGIPKGTVRTEMLALDLRRDDGRDIYGLVHVRLLINSIFLNHTNK